MCQMPTLFVFCPHATDWPGHTEGIVKITFTNVKELTFEKPKNYSTTEWCGNRRPNWLLPSLQFEPTHQSAVVVMQRWHFYTSTLLQKRCYSWHIQYGKQNWNASGERPLVPKPNYIRSADAKLQSFDSTRHGRATTQAGQEIIYLKCP